MNPCLPDWNFDCDVSLTSHKKPMGSDNELVELLWRDGNLVMHSQTHRKPSPVNNEPRQVHQKHDHQILRGSGSYGNSSNIIQDDETASWIHYTVEDPFEEEFCSNIFNELSNSDAMDTDKPIRQFEDDKYTKLSASDTACLTTSAEQSNTRQPFVPEVSGNPMPPPRIQVPDSGQQNQTPGGVGKVVNFSQFAAPIRGALRQNSSHFAGQASTKFTQGDIREGSVMTVGSSHCGSNQVVNDPDFSRASSIGGDTSFSAGMLMEDIQKIVSPNEGRKTETLEPTITSSSGGSGSSFGGTTNKQLDTSSCKRKDRDDADELECQSGGAELDSASGKKPARSGSTRRTRAAEVHNLSERRRRDRINKKMRALQELIPHCNKTDKASMLDEAIDYLKTLQRQLQVMWMGSGMASMMFPGVQHFMTPVGMGMGPSNLPGVHNSMHFPRVPVVDQSMPMTASPGQAMIHTPVMNQVNFQNQIQNQMFSDQVARYMGMHPIQAASQPMNMFRFASPTVQPIYTSVSPASSVGPFTGGAAGDDISSGKMGQ